MEKDVVISVMGMQKFEQQDSDKVELVTEGHLVREAGNYILTYHESEMTGLEGTMTTIQVNKAQDQVTLIRVGQFNSQMVFQEGRRHLSMYNTPYGAMAVGVNTRHMYAELNDVQGEIEVDYNIEVDHSVAGRNIFKISFKEAEGASLKQ